MHSLYWIHKDTCNGLPLFHPILSASGISTYKLVKLVLQVSTPSACDEHTYIDEFQFQEEICQQDQSFHMVCLDIHSLYTNFSLEETMNILIGNLHNANVNLPNTLKYDNWPSITTIEYFCIFSKKFKNKWLSCRLVSLGPPLANSFVCSFENIWLQDSLKDFKLGSRKTMLMTYFTVLSK